MKSVNTKKITAAILTTGLIAGSLDILFAFANAWWSLGVSPERVLRFIASGLIGEKAFQDLHSIALLGLTIHFFIAFFWTIIFFLFYPKLQAIVRQRFLQGFLYGIFVWLIMNLIVLPLSNAPKPGFHWPDAIKGIIILIIAIGFPLAYFAQKYYQENTHRR